MSAGALFRKLAHNVGWKALALAIALILWVAFVGRPELDTSVSAPVQYQNMPADLEMSADAPERVYLEVRGPAVGLRSFDPSRAAVVFNLASVQRAGEYTFTVERTHIDLPFGLKLVRATPSQLRLRFERRVSADVPVRIRFSGPPPEGFRVGRESASPQTLKIVGPESRVRQIGYVETDPIDLSHIAGAGQFRVHVFVADPQVRFVTPPDVQVEIELEKAIPGGVRSDEGQTAIRD